MSKNKKLKAIYKKLNNSPTCRVLRFFGLNTFANSIINSYINRYKDLIIK